jgi:hypothetical protein
MSSLQFPICQNDPQLSSALIAAFKHDGQPGVHLIKQLAHQLQAQDVDALQIRLRRLAMAFLAMPCPA